MKSRQREKPGGITPAQLGAMVGIDPANIIMSGTQIENFREGWAHPIMRESRVAHYFTRSLSNIGRANSKCGLDAEVRWLYGRGNWAFCRRCKQRIAREGGLPKSTVETLS